MGSFMGFLSRFLSISFIGFIYRFHACLFCLQFPTNFLHLRITPAQITSWKYQRGMFDIWLVSSAKICGHFHIGWVASYGWVDSATMAAV